MSAQLPWTDAAGMIVVMDEQYQMPLVVHTPRDAAPTHSDVLIAAGQATVSLWADERASHEWADAISAWMAGRFRKVTRRARGAQWDAIAELDGVTATHGTATVKALIPVPFGDLDQRIRRLQVSGTDFAPHELPAAPSTSMPVLWLAPDLVMTTGKAAAQVSHMALLLSKTATPEQLEHWRDTGWEFTVVEATAEQWDALADAAHEIVDAGFTEIAPATATVRSTGLPY